MCEFISWIEFPGRNYFLTDEELNTFRGEELREYLGTGYWSDIKGHGAIRWYYNIPDMRGVDHECTDFSTPDNFPSEIVEAIKQGKFTQIGIAFSILTKPALAEYEKIEQPALAEYEKIRQAALAEYEKIRQAAWAEYEKIEQPALAEYEKIEQPAWAEYEKIRQAAWAEYEKIEQPAWAEYEKIEQPAWAEYEKIRQAALAEYEKIEQPALAEYKKIQRLAFWNILTEPKNRIEAWR